MNITDVRIRKVEEDSKLKAIASITFDDSFAVHDIKILEGNNGLFVAMPSKKIGEGNFKDVAHPITSEARKEVTDTILEAYRNQSEE